MLSKKKKIIIISAMSLLLVVTGYLNIALNNNVTDAVINANDGNVEAVNADAENQSFFVDYRTTRVTTRNEEIDYLNAIIASSATTEEAKKVAQEKKIEIIGNMESELVLEGLIKSAGFEDAIVTNTSTSVNVIIKSKELAENQVSQIVSIIGEQTGKGIDNIKIFPIE